MDKTIDPGREIAAIGVDRGGTWTRVAAFDIRLRPVRAARFRTTPLRSLPKILVPLVLRWRGGAAAPLVIATRGALGSAWKKPFLFKTLAPKLRLVEVISDAEAAHFAAFGGKKGMLLIAGTGSVVLSGKPGAFKKTGGLNPPSGDPGSGRWLGRKYLKLRGRLHEAGKMGHGRSASHAKKLLSLAAAGTGPCVEFAESAARELASLLRDAAGKKTELRVALAGGLMHDPRFKARFLKAARLALTGRKLTFVKALIPAEKAAARIALLRREQ